MRLGQIEVIRGKGLWWDCGEPTTGLRSTQQSVDLLGRTVATLFSGEGAVVFLRALR